MNKYDPPSIEEMWQGSALRNRSDPRSMAKCLLRLTVAATFFITRCIGRDMSREESDDEPRTARIVLRTVTPPSQIHHDTEMGVIG